MTGTSPVTRGEAPIAKKIDSMGFEFGLAELSPTLITRARRLQSAENRADNVGIIVSPDPLYGVGLRFPVAGLGERTEILVGAGDCDHGAGKNVIGIVLPDVAGVVDARHHVVGGGDAGDHGGELEVAVGDVDGNYSV